MEFVVIVLVAGVAPLLVFAGVAIVLLRRAEPMQRARRQAIATLCGQRGLAPGLVSTPNRSLQLRGLLNPFSSPDGKVIAGDAARGEGKQVALFSLLSFTVDGLNMPRVAVLRQRRASLIDVWGPVLELESSEFDKRFAVIAENRRSAVMLLDQGMIQWLLDCDNVGFEMTGDTVVAFTDRFIQPAHPPAEPVEYQLLFKFGDGFVLRVPPLLRSEYSTAQPPPG